MVTVGRRPLIVLDQVVVVTAAVGAVGGVNKETVEVERGGPFEGGKWCITERGVANETCLMADVGGAELGVREESRAMVAR